MKRIVFIIILASSSALAQHKEINFAWVQAIENKNLNLDSLIAITFPDAVGKLVDDALVIELDSVPMYGVQGKFTATFRKDYIDTSQTRSEFEWTSRVMNDKKFSQFRDAMNKVSKPKMNDKIVGYSKKNFFAWFAIAPLNELESGIMAGCSIKK
jgi:hypothetical protein